MTHPDAPDAPGQWTARLELRFAPRGGRTAMVHAAHFGPLRVQRPFYPEAALTGGATHVYLLHPPGGVVGGDALTINVAVEAGGGALLTSPAAGKFYGSDGRIGRLSQRLRVAAGASLEWMPLEAIFFEGTQAVVQTRLDVDPEGAAFLWDITALGRPAAGKEFTRGACTQRLEIWRGDRLLWRDRARYDGGAALLSAPWGLGGHSVVGTLLGVARDSEATEHWVAAVREGLAKSELPAGVTRLGDVVVVRALGHDAEAVRVILRGAWATLRPALLGRAAVAPRIWAC